MCAKCSHYFGPFIDSASHTHTHANAHTQTHTHTHAQADHWRAAIARVYVHAIESSSDGVALSHHASHTQSHTDTHSRTMPSVAVQHFASCYIALVMCARTPVMLTTHRRVLSPVTTLFRPNLSDEGKFVTFSKGFPGEKPCADTKVARGGLLAALQHPHYQGGRGRRARHCQHAGTNVLWKCNAIGL